MRSVGSYNTDQASRKELVLTNYEMWSYPVRSRHRVQGAGHCS
jgi:hypothetical protein